MARTTTYRYDGNHASTRWEYDGRGRMTKKRYAFGYDEAGKPDQPHGRPAPTRGFPAACAPDARDVNSLP